jgi:hypothetical protein
MKTEHEATLPGFVAAAALRSGGRYSGVDAGGRSAAIYPAQARDAQGEKVGLNPHFCPGVCWCCERYETFDCCYACAVCYIVASA